MKYLSLNTPTMMRMAANLQAGASWWWEQMSTLWPISTFLKDPASQLVTVRLGATAEAKQASNAFVLPTDLEAVSDQDIARLKDQAQGAPIRILLDPAQTYVCSARFPKAALKAGSQTIAYHLQTASPLPVEDIIYDVVTREDGDNILAEIAITRTSTIEDIAAFFARHDLPLDGIGALVETEISDPKQANDTLNFTFFQRLSFGHGLYSARVALGLCLSLISLPILCALGAFVYGSFEVRSLDARLETQRSSYAEDIRLTRSFDHYTAIASQLHTGQTPDQISKLIADLAAATPKDAWLEQLSIDKGDVALQGYSRSSNEAANQLRTIPELTDIRLNRVTASGDASGAPLFSIAAQWTPCDGGGAC